MSYTGVLSGLLSLLLVLPSCSGSSGPVEHARFLLRHGQLEQAQALLEERGEPEAVKLLAEIRRSIVHREETIELLARMREERRGRPAQELEFDLTALLQGERDPILEKRIRSERSALVDWLAERRAGVPIRRGRLPGGDPVPSGDAESEPSVQPSRELDPLLTDVLQSIETARRGGFWSEALTLTDMALGDAPVYADHLLPIRMAIRRQSDQAALDFMALVRSLQTSGDRATAEELLLARARRFPAEGEGLAVHAQLEESRRSPASVAAVVPPKPAEASARSAPAASRSAVRNGIPDAPDAETAAEAADALLEAIELSVKAVKKVSAGDLAAARALWQAAARISPREAQRCDFEQRAFEAGSRLQLRTELETAQLTASASSEPQEGSVGVPARGVRRAGGLVPWEELSWDDWRQLSEGVALGPRARLGLALEMLRLGRVEGVRGGLAELARLVRRGELKEERAWRIVAAQRAERVPGGGYEVVDGAWKSSDDLERERIGHELKRLASKVARSRGEECSAALDELLKLAVEGNLADSTAREVVTEKWTRATSELVRSTSLRRLKALADQRRDLDEARARALALIFDTETYFYPYSPPAIPGKTLTDYMRAQQQVDDGVQAVSEVWDAGRVVVLAQGFRRALETLEMLEPYAEALGLALGWPSELPTWVAWLDPDQEEATLATLAWDESEALELQRGRAIHGYNQDQWSREWPEHQAVTRGERRQVQITNDYRRLMGRPALAWNPLLSGSAGWHSQYMSTTGDFGHYEKGDAENKTPYDRMRREGYTRGASENCHSGSADPLSAHQAWLRSSGHHRNLLQASHTEMASAQAGAYWTQNFGNDTIFEAGLSEWQD